MNHLTGEIKTQTVFMGDFPLMTEKGTFIINGTERVVVSQLVRSPGVYFAREAEKPSDKDIFSARIIPSRGAWLEFEIDKRDQVGVRIDRKRKQSVTVFLKALGMTSEEILEEFKRLPVDRVDPREGCDPHQGRGAQGHLPQAPSGRAGCRRGRRVRCWTTSTSTRSATTSRRSAGTRSTASSGSTATLKPSRCSDAPGHHRDDQVPGVAARQQLAERHRGDNGIATIKGVRDGKKVDMRLDVDDIDHFGNRRIRAVGELIQNQVRTGLCRMERVVRERMTTQDIEAITPQTLINVRPVVAAIKEFFEPRSCRSSWTRTTRSRV